MRLPEDVAVEVASTLVTMARINGIKKFQPLHIEVAHKLVEKKLLEDTIQWYNYMFGRDYA